MGEAGDLEGGPGVGARHHVESVAVHAHGRPGQFGGFAGPGDDLAPDGAPAGGEADVDVAASRARGDVADLPARRADDEVVVGVVGGPLEDEAAVGVGGGPHGHEAARVIGGDVDGGREGADAGARKGLAVGVGDPAPDGSARFEGEAEQGAPARLVGEGEAGRAHAGRGGEEREGRCGLGDCQ